MTTGASINNTTDLKRFLLEQMVNVSTGKQEPSSAKAICNYVQQLYNVSNLEVRVAQTKVKLGVASIEGVRLLPDNSDERI